MKFSLLMSLLAAAAFLSGCASSRQARTTQDSVGLASIAGSPLAEPTGWTLRPVSDVP